MQPTTHLERMHTISLHQKHLFYFNSRHPSFLSHGRFKPIAYFYISAALPWLCLVSAFSKAIILPQCWRLTLPNVSLIYLCDAVSSVFLIISWFLVGLMRFLQFNALCYWCQSFSSCVCSVWAALRSTILSLCPNKPCYVIVVAIPLIHFCIIHKECDAECKADAMMALRVVNIIQYLYWSYWQWDDSI